MSHVNLLYRYSTEQRYNSQLFVIKPLMIQYDPV
jgi:hypothetical protein